MTFLNLPINAVFITFHIYKCQKIYQLNIINKIKKDPPPPPPPKKARERYQNLPKEEKEEKWQYGCGRYKNLSEDAKN